jgi:putative membrane protein
MKQLHPGFKISSRIANYFGWGLILILCIFPFAILKFTIGLDFPFLVPAVVGAIVLLLILIEMGVRFGYKNWKYELSETELKIERGIFGKVYKSIPYERVQNVDIQRGVIARMFGFSGVGIHTAGYGAGGTEGYLPAVSVKEAEEIREFLIRKIKK